MGHDLYKTGDHDAPDAIKDRNGEVALGQCRRCGAAEVDLSGPCDRQYRELRRASEAMVGALDNMHARGETFTARVSLATAELRAVLATSQ
jgi:hypothetical protein